MQESDTYLAILDAGKEKQTKKILLLVAQRRLGPPDESAKTGLEGITDLERLERMTLQAVTAATWEEILATPGRRLEEEGWHSRPVERGDWPDEGRIAQPHGQG
jgi:hypothetical protein